MDYKQTVVEALAKALDGQLTADEIAAKLERPKTSDKGDMAFPTFTLAKVLHQAPQQIAQDLADKLETTDFEKVEVVGPYLNFFFDKGSYSEATLQTVLTDGASYGQNEDGQGGNVPIDMSSPNIAKPMSMGHLRSTVIGNSIAEILTKNGYHPIKDNHLGDWGTQFGKLITAYKLWGNEADVKADPINKLVEYYIRFHKEDVEKPELDDIAREWFKKLEDGDEEAHRLWKWFREASLQEFNDVYDELGVKFDTYNGEAFYNDKLEEVVQILKDKHLLVESQGAQVVDLSKYDLNPALILKSDGASLYITRDIATALYRDRTYAPAKNLYVVGSEQTYYFKQLKAVLKEMGVKSADNLQHVPFGLITVDGKKLSTRSGRIILLAKVLEESVKLAAEEINEKNPDLANKQAVAQQVGVGAIVFGDLKNERTNNIDFVLADQLKFEGETGPYVQYAHARAESMLRKAANVDVQPAGNQITDPEAWDTIKTLADFPAIVKMACKELEPSVVAKYAIRLAKTFNKYYAHSKILTEDAELSARLALVKAVSTVLKEALRLLGVQAPDEM
ncbi:arginine--tRNA ligase [Levilactobacillus tujiorum]|uniref:Arginine--tRNA ligase n=1 Tax=Levilactobacillus tujiorum TaxID=2912243 RepID=A0ABX1L1K2_9LACO|nr:arginine--tRNA ligase [Levilactobacillus tujiorum]MCH5463933.1 arginine--tRNA ligase [Levilactobacillus tujiorum]NLR11561.1 arginine--tRNA ligase [Lactobacillus sp. HBUAS51387]NLR28921.1 arginine--tRNA ligase [Levilactobacillus tujiorum]